MCYFLDHNRAISISYDKNKIGRCDFEKPCQLFCWDVSNVKNWKKLFDVNHCIIVPIIGFNSQLNGLVINGKVRPLAEAFIELTQNIVYFESLPF